MENTTVALKIIILPSVVRSVCETTGGEVLPRLQITPPFPKRLHLPNPAVVDYRMV
jgi:hypothetical protein